MRRSSVLLAGLRGKYNDLARARMNYSLESYNLLATISEACFTSNYWRAHAPSKAPSSV